MKKNFCTKFLSLSIALLIILSALPMTNGATKYTVDVKKTDIEADVVFNTNGYASLTKKYRLSEEEKADAYRSLIEYKLEEGETVEDYLKKNGFENIEEYYLYYVDIESYRFTNSSALMDKNGNIIMPYVSASNAYYVSENIISKGNTGAGYALDDNESNGFFELNGKTIFNTAYAFSSIFSDGLAFVRYTTDSSNQPENFKSYFIDENENIVLSLPDSFSECDGIGLNPTFYYHDFTGYCNTYSEGLIGFTSLYRYSEDIFEDVHKREDIYLYGYMDIQGNIVILQQFYSGGSFYNGLSWVQEIVTIDNEYYGPQIDGGKFGYINKQGELIIPFMYDDVTDFDGEYAAVSKDGKWGLINTKGETVIPFEYDFMGINDGIIICSTDMKTAPLTLMTVDKEIIWQTAAENADVVSAYDEGVLYYIKDGYVYIVSVTSENVPDSKKGDIDGDGAITSSDARLTLRAAVGLETLTEEISKLIDVDKDGAVTASDARLILRAAVGLEAPAKW